MPNINDKAMEFERAIKEKYTTMEKETDVRIIEAIQRILAHARDPNKTTTAILEETTRMIFSVFKFKEIIIGLKDRNNGLFKHEIFLGYSRQVEQALRKTYYDEEYFIGYDKQNGIPLSKFTKYRMIEHQVPEDWQNVYEQHMDELASDSLRNPRTSIEEIHDGDEILVFMYGPNESLIGWIDLGLTIDKKLPPGKSLKYIELIASVIASIVYEREFLCNSG